MTGFLKKNWAYVAMAGLIVFPIGLDSGSAPSDHGAARDKIKFLPAQKPDEFASFRDIQRIYWREKKGWEEESFLYNDHIAFVARNGALYYLEDKNVMVAEYRLQTFSRKGEPKKNHKITGKPYEDFIITEDLTDDVTCVEIFDFKNQTVKKSHIWRDKNGKIINTTPPVSATFDDVENGKYFSISVNNAFTGLVDIYQYAQHLIQESRKPRMAEADHSLIWG